VSAPAAPGYGPRAMSAVPTTSEEQSLWLDTAPSPPREALADGREVDVDVAIIGGGIAGVTTALLLKREGARVAVLEAATVGAGVTGCTTAKVSALQSTLLSTIRSRHGMDAAAVYADASLTAVDRIAQLVADEAIECDLERRPAATYAASESELAAVTREADVAREAGLAVTTSDRLDLPYPVAGAVVLAGQLQLHPVRYVRGLADAVEGDGSYVFENSRATRVEDGSPCRVHTGEGTITAEHVVVASHYPTLDRGLFFARLKAERSYCVATPVAGRPPEVMAISAGGTTRSIRSYGDILIVGGEGHAAGSTDATPERYAALETFARDHWDAGPVTHRWSAQDPLPYDHLPVIGRLTPASSRLWVSSGFMKWGLTSATFGALILADAIGGRTNPWSDRFTPNRVSLRSAPELAQLGLKFGFDFVADRVWPAQAGSTGEVPRGEARVVRDGLGKTGVYRDDHGRLHAVSLRCTHLGCLLRFNAAERSWDCPCHGSRFDVDGEVLEGPAVSPLEQREAGES
jgi:glycine/D-amino acid oxidase-like deaminating enzyme/nitrite reductase/ring-hydroxylating ferredoxin subunit